MSGFSPSLSRDLLRLSISVRQSISLTPYTSPEGSTVSVKCFLESLLPPKPHSPCPQDSDEYNLLSNVKNFCLCCAVLASSSGSCQHLEWIPKSLSDVAVAAFQEFSTLFFAVYSMKKSKRVGDFEIDYSSLSDDKKLVVELMPDLLRLMKASIKESSIDTSDDGADMHASSARVPVVYAILSAYQFRWFATQVEYPVMGKMCNLIIPCALTALDHWSPEVKGQGMISFIHMVKNINATELRWYQDAILDACCQNISSSDEIWHLVVEMSVLVVTSTNKSNPRSQWFDRILSEMLGHMERQPGNKERRVVWLKQIDPLFYGMGMVLLAHFRRIFRLLFQWMHSDDDTISLVLQRLQTIIKITWIRNSPHVERLLDELASLYKEAALREACEEIRTHILQILLLLQACKGGWLGAAWEKHRDDPEMPSLCLPLCTNNMSMNWTHGDCNDQGPKLVWGCPSVKAVLLGTGPINRQPVSWDSGRTGTESCMGSEWPP